MNFMPLCRLPANYPNVVPILTLEDPIGVSNDAVRELQKKLQDTAKALLPNEAIFELASEAASYITSHHAIIQSHVPSLIDQLGARAAIEEEVRFHAFT
jgi:translation initiation factor 2-alpha kinase 4